MLWADRCSCLRSIVIRFLATFFTIFRISHYITVNFNFLLSWISCVLRYLMPLCTFYFLRIPLIYSLHNALFFIYFFFFWRDNIFTFLHVGSVLIGIIGIIKEYSIMWKMNKESLFSTKRCICSFNERWLRV